MKNEQQPIEETLPLAFWQKVIVYLNISFYIVYSIWWVQYAINPTHPIYSWAFFSVELLGCISSFMFLFSVLKLRRRVPPTLMFHPTVDVFITTYNEPTEILLTTVYHCKNMDYPHETYLLDDGQRPEVKKLAEEMGIHYLTRPDNTDAKAGNLNNGLWQSRGEIIAIFDADGVPRKDFLTQLLGYFEDAKVALVQTPQTFYNLDSFQHANSASENLTWHEQSLFFDIIQPGRDYREAAMCCGNGCLFRRSSLDEIGGFSIGTVTEDLHTTVSLHLKGFRSVYDSRPIAFCLAPASVSHYVVQRSRWALGTVQTLRKEWRSLLAPGGLSLAQRLAYRMSLYYFTAIQRSFYYVAPLLSLAFGISPIVQEDWFVFPILIHMVLSIASYYIVSRGRARLFLTEIFFLYTLVPYLGSIVKGLLPFFKPRFRVTSKLASEKSSWTLLWPAYLVIVFSTIAVIYGIQALNRGATNFGLIFTIGLAWFHGAVGLGAIFTSRKRPVTEDSYSFFDFRPFQIRQVNGARVIKSANAGVVTIFSEKGLNVVYPAPYPIGTHLVIELVLPHTKLLLDTIVSKYRPVFLKGQEPLFEMDLKFQGLKKGDRTDLIRYFFEDATPHTFASLLTQKKRRYAHAEHRRRSRAAVLLPVFVPLESSSNDNRVPELYVGLVMDMSVSGARIKLPASIPVGKMIEVQIPWNKSRINAKVVRCVRETDQVNPTYNVGLVYESEMQLTPMNLSSLNPRQRAMP